MRYIQGFVAAVPEERKEAYRKHASGAFPLFKEFGVLRMVESWEDDVPNGTVTDLRRAVKAEPGEKIVFSWFEFASKAAADAASKKMMEDPRMAQMGGEMPFDGKRMIYGGFETLSDVGKADATGYISGMVAPASANGKESYTEFARSMAAIFQEYGATRLLDAWGVDVPAGEVTDFQRAVQAKDDETIAFGWIEWPSKEACDSGWEKMMSDERMQNTEMPFDGKRMIFGNFRPIVDLS
ncbi:DUF1428 domain-containing protein [Henriciella marina]|uniref:DUF1428 domain-containing protein n=1 Tax=Henriciella marina TaxID=453851 RepID=UPI00037313F1|nr:DUF1428 domain-containing protein [Henriciella marina]